MEQLITAISIGFLDSDMQEKQLEDFFFVILQAIHQ